METTAAVGLLAFGFVIGGVVAFLFAYLIYRNRGERIRLELDNEKSLLNAELESVKTNYQNALDQAVELETKFEERGELVNSLATDKASLETRIEEDTKNLQNELERVAGLEKKIEEQSQIFNTVSVEMAELETTLTEERKNSEEKLTAFLEAQEALKDSFSTLSIEALEKNRKAFMENAEQILKGYQESAVTDLEHRHKGIKNLVDPLKEQLEKVDEFVREVDKERKGAYDSLIQRVDQMSESQGQLKSTASQLVKVLSNTKSRGQWGEIQLKRVVELAGMMEHCDFDEQSHIEREEGGNRPDLVVHLPGSRTIFVDAKAPMDAYLAAHEATEDGVRQELFIKHAKAIRSHVTALKNKNYHGAVDDSPDFVFMFLPNEAVYSTALEYDPKLIEDGAAENVIIATPITLVALLKATAHDWRQEKIADEVKKFSELGREFYERLAMVTKYISRLGKSIDKTVMSYNTMVGSIEGRLIPTAKKFHDSSLVGQSKKKLQEPSRVDHSVRQLSDMDSVEDPAIVQEDLDNLADDFEEQFGELQIADAAGGGE